jgi:class 3 adenylate cyclase/HAMP domain-containing protein
MEQLIDYADSQYRLLLSNNLLDNPEYTAVAVGAIESYAQSLIRSETELILAVDETGQDRIKTFTAELSSEDFQTLKSLLEREVVGWNQIRLAGADRVAQIARYQPFGWYVLVTERRDTFYQAINEMFWQTGVILLVACVISVLLLLVFTFYLIRPLRNVVTAMRGIIETNDLSKRVEVLYRDETGELGHTFNLMTGELDKAYEQIKGFALQAVIAQHKEQKVRNIFQKYVPKDVIDQFFANPESMLVGDDRILALLFSDVRGFTTLSEKMLPNEVVESLNQYFGMMVDVIMKHDGIVDKYMGDAIMAFFGAPVRRGDEALRAVRSSFDMLKVLDDFNKWQRDKGRSPFRIGIGINYGVVTVGNIGSEKKMDYTVIGDMVNLASRLEGLSKVYKESIIISESVVRSVEKVIPCRLLDKVVVKGKTSGIGIYTPHNSLSPREREAWELHGKAVELYYERDFQEAASLFEKVGQILPEDECSRIFRSRCTGYIENPPPSGWTGAIVMSEK